MNADQVHNQAPAGPSFAGDLAGGLAAPAMVSGSRFGEIPIDLRFGLLRLHGSFSQAYSATVQPGLRYFGDERGFIAHKEIWGTAMVLAEPVAPLQTTEELIDGFLREHPDAAFCQASRRVASLLSQRGFLVNEFGVETWLDLQSYTLEGQHKQNLRWAVNRMGRLGYVLREHALSALDIDDVKSVSTAWRKTRTYRNRELGFLTRPILFEDDPDVRWFFAFAHDGRLMAFCICDPIYKAGSIVGYLAAVRSRPDADMALGIALKCHAAEAFRQEGKRWMSLGLSPLCDIRDDDFEHDRVTRRVLQIINASALFNRFVYPLHGHALHKRQFHGITTQTYLAVNKQLVPLRLLKLLRACDMI